MPAGSRAAGTIHDRFSSKSSRLRLGRNSRIGVKPASCSTIRWIVMSLTPKLVRIVAGPSEGLFDREVRLVFHGRPAPAHAVLIEADLDLAVDDAHRVRLQILGRRRVQHLAAADVKPRGMQRALDYLAIEPAVGQAGIGVSADVVCCKEVAVGVVERDRMAGNLYSDDLAFSQVATCGGPNPARILPTHRLVSRRLNGPSGAGDAPRRAGEECRQIIAKTDHPLLLPLAFLLPRLAHFGDARKGRDVRPVSGCRRRLRRGRAAIPARRAMLGRNPCACVAVTGMRAALGSSGAARPASPALIVFELCLGDPGDDYHWDVPTDQLDDCCDGSAVFGYSQHQRPA